MTGKERVDKNGKGITRRDFIKYVSTSAGIAAATIALSKSVAYTLPTGKASLTTESLYGHPTGVAAVAQTEGGITPMDFLTDFYQGQVNPLTGEREFSLTAVNQPVTVAREVQFPAWAFRTASANMATVPGPTLRCVQGDKVRLRLVNGTGHPHTIHLHGIHPALADGVFEPVDPGKVYEYAFDAEPFGLFLYHCHIMPVKKHIAKGLYGAFIIDPADPPNGPGPRPRAEREFVMVMNGFDVDFDDENDFYTVNGIANYFLENPITIRVGELVRIYLVNMTEFDPVNSFHLHGNVYRLYRTGTRFDPTAVLDRNPARPLDTRIREWLYLDNFAEITDNVFLGQGERAVIEFVPPHPGRFLFHAHQSEFIELGWTGVFNVI